MAGPSRRYSNVLAKPPVVNAMSSKEAYYNDLGRTYGPVAAAAYEKFGLEPWQKRSNLLPYYSKDTGWVAPQIVYSAAKAALAPGVAASGYRVGPDEAMNFALTAVGSGQVGSIATGGAPPGSVGMNAYHGSSHKFDQFDLSKVGTGEGAQAYGHGIYLAENPGTAGNYVSAGLRGEDATAAHYLKVYGGDREAAANAILNENPAGAVTERALAYSKKVAEILISGKEVKGNLYHVDLPDSTISKMLDWDKPLSEQPAAIRSAFDELRRNIGDAEFNKMTGGAAYQTMGNAEETSAMLRSAGVPGIKYLDAGSRGAQEGTRNFVVFDPGTVKIIKRE